MDLNLFLKTLPRPLIYGILQIESGFDKWGDEIYFAISLRLGYENPKKVVEGGDLGYWPEGHCFCIFYGKTPASRGDEIRPASPVNVFEKVTGNSEVFKKVKSNSKIIVERAE